MNRAQNRHPGKGMGMDMQQMMMQAQKMQQDLAQAQDALKDQKVTGTAGGGMVTVAMTGDLHVDSVTIEPEVLEEADTELLQDMICAAVNDAIGNAQKLSDDQLGGITGGLNIPGMM